MAASHVRSNSLPSNLNPLAAQVDEDLSRLRSSETASTSSSSICQKLNDLHDLHGCINKMLQQSVHQQALSQEQNKKMVEGLLDGSLRLLDVCNVSKDALGDLEGGRSSYNIRARFGRLLYLRFQGSVKVKQQMVAGLKAGQPKKSSMRGRRKQHK